jgi:hypothetical protein
VTLVTLVTLISWSILASEMKRLDASHREIVPLRITVSPSSLDSIRSFRSQTRRFYQIAP